MMVANTYFYSAEEELVASAVQMIADADWAPDSAVDSVLLSDC